MGNFAGTVITPRGLDLVAKSQTGTTINFTRVGVGDGTWGAGDSAETLLDLKNERLSLDINTLDVVGDGTARLRAIITNAGLQTGFFVREIGVFATDPGLGEILYAVAYAGSECDFLPAAGAVMVEEIFDLLTVVGNASSITAEISEYLVIASKDEIDLLASFAAQALADTGVLSKEIDAQRFSRHQQGTLTIYNRGVVSGCALTKSSTITRAIDLALGEVFGHGREWGVAAQAAGCTVPENETGASSICHLYVREVSGVMELQCTALNTAVPDDAIELATITVPNGSTALSDQYLAGCTLTPTARNEPNWPLVQTSPAYEDVTFDRVMAATSYSVVLDVDDYEGGERPELTAPGANRATNTMRIYLGGSADAVDIRYTTHLMTL